PDEAGDRLLDKSIVPALVSGELGELRKALATDGIDLTSQLLGNVLSPVLLVVFSLPLESSVALADSDNTSPETYIRAAD
ncbi:hypothetical protein FRC11_010869, partial [Ceratobasidium sp. 423]